MGGCSSKLKNIETGEMDTPVYQQQGDLDEYLNLCESDYIDTDLVWQPRRKKENLYTLDDEDMYLSSEGTLTDVWGELNEETSELVIRETVVDGPDAMEDTSYATITYASMTEDLYSIISASSETNIKQLVDIDETAHAKKYFEVGTSARPQRRLHRYEEMIIIFQPLIVQNVIARRLIPHLTFLDDADKVNVIADRSPRSAVLYIIDELKNNHKDPCRWKQFIEALEQCEYRDIAGILRGEKPVDHSYQREYLKIITPFLRINISPIELAEVLWSADVISDEDKKEIQQMHNNFGTLAATDRLLDRVPRKHRYWYSHLIEGLRKTEMENAAEMLDIPELSVNSGDHVEPLTRKQTTQSIERADTRPQPSKIQLNDAQIQEAVATEGSNRSQQLPSKPFGKRPMPLPRIKTMSTDTNKRQGKKEIDLDESFYDNGYTEIDDTPSPAIDDYDFEEVTNDGDEIESDKKKNVRRNVEMCADTRVNEELSSEKEKGAVQLNKNRQGALKRSRSLFIQLREAEGSNQTQQLPSKPFCNRPMPLPRIKNISTDTNERPEKKEMYLDENYYDDAYTTEDDKPSLAIADDGYVEVSDGDEEIESDNKKNLRRNVENCADSRVNEEISSEKEKSAVQLNKNRQGALKRSRSLPIQLREATESSIEYYSQPFRDEITKTEKTLTVSHVDVCEPDCRDINGRTKLADKFHRLGGNKVREIFNTCSKKYGIDQEGIESDMNAQELSQSSIYVVGRIP